MIVKAVNIREHELIAWNLVFELEECVAMGKTPFCPPFWAVASWGRTCYCSFRCIADAPVASLALERKLPAHGLAA